MEFELVTPVDEIGVITDLGMLFVAKNGESYYIFSFLPIGKPMSLFVAPCDSEGTMLPGSTANHKIVDCSSLEHGLGILGITVKGLP